MSQHRERPADFDEVRQRIKGIAALRAHYKAGQKAVIRWLGDDIGERYTPPLRPVPDDFAQQCAVKSCFQLSKHYRTHYDIVKRWLDLTGLKPLSKSGPKLKPAPDDFAEVALGLTQTGLAGHYKVSHGTIKRWIAETGVKPMVFVPAPPRRIGNTPACYHRGQKMVVMDTRKHSVYDMAADTLRRERWIVYRCDSKGTAKPEGEFWRVGNLVCDNDELLVRAARYERRAA